MDFDYFCMPGGPEKSLSVREITKYFNIIDEKRWKTFDEYANHVNTINYVSFNKKDWLMSVCSCEWWAKNYFCHHVIGLAVSKKKAVYLDIHMTIPIGHTRPRGQPKKTASALEKQQDALVSSSDSSSSDTDSDPSPLKKKVVPQKLKAKGSTQQKKRGPKPKKL